MIKLQIKKSIENWIWVWIMGEKASIDQCPSPFSLYEKIIRHESEKILLDILAFFFFFVKRKQKKEALFPQMKCKAND